MATFEERVEELTIEALEKYGGSVEEYEEMNYSSEVAEAYYAQDIADANYRAVRQAIAELADPDVASGKKKRSRASIRAQRTDPRLTVAAAEKKVAKLERIKLQLELNERPELPGQMDRIEANLIKLHRIIANPAGRGTKEGQVQWRFMARC